jgi:hypothetical protein
MDICKSDVIAIKIHPHTLSMITAVNGGVTPEIEATPTYFMIYCVDTNHEETDIIAEDVFERTYGPMHPNVLATTVKPID